MKNCPMILIQSLAPLLFVLSGSAQAQTPVDEMFAAQAIYYAKREAVMRENAAAIAGLNIAVDPVAIAALRTDLDALKTQAATDATRTAAVKAAAATALAAATKATTIAALRASLLPLLSELAK